MQDLQPKAPKNLNPLARELLESLAGHAEAAEIVLGGGVALSHYLEYRDTVDVDAWWRTEPADAVFALAERCMKELATKHGLTYRRRTWSETESLELLRGTQKTFSFQISKRTLYLDNAIPTEWQPLWIETLRDNVGSKMTALVQRGAPRDFLDIYELVNRSLISCDDCWDLWVLKNPSVSLDEAKRKVFARLEMIETTRPLSTIQPIAAREKAALVRSWYRAIFTQPPAA
ncbi:MAG: hypothetical protein JWO08_2399 [Verrucomicrobiaceae bacterium]|nr:hypothetical protein [Verrucomicrobiaceae bacterium]